MHKPERSRNAALDQTWPDCVGAESEPTRNSSVTMLRVKLIGSSDEVSAPLVDGKTRPYPSALPSFTAPVPANHDADDNEYWHDVSALTETVEPCYQPLAYAHTLPAISLEDLGLEDSGVREIMRLQLRLDARDSVPTFDQRDGAPTLRVSAAERSALGNAWQTWEQQSPGMTIFTASVLCVLSALAVSLFAH